MKIRSKRCREHERRISILGHAAHIWFARSPGIYRHPFLCRAEASYQHPPTTEQLILRELRAINQKLGEPHA